MKAYMILLCSLAAAAAYNNVTIKNLRLFDGNTEFFIKSTCYSPAPAGYFYGNAGDGPGVCSPRTQYRIDATRKELATINACFYEDFFDGSVDPNGAGNQNGWFADLWTRDLPKIAATGTNVVRFYHSNPITKQLVFDDAGYPVKGYGSDYKPFMDAVAANGMKVVFPLFAELDQILNFPTAVMEQYIRSLVDNVGNHPALLMWQFGNELPLTVPDNNLGPTLITKLNHFFDYARSYTFVKWQRYLPISVALVDLPSAYNMLVRDLKTDIVTTNAGYRGPGYSDLWTGNAGQNFDGLHSLSCQYGKPVWIGEIGQHSNDGFINQNDWFTQNWGALIDNIKRGAIGGALFEYSDEAWKAENQRSMGIVKIDSDTQVTAKTGPGAYNYDVVTAAFKRDVFAEMGRAPFTLDNVDNSVCSQFSFPSVSTPLYAFIDVGDVNTTHASTYTSAPTPTGNSNNGGNSGGNGACGTGLSQCGSACYKASEYCCSGDVLYVAGTASCSATTSPIATTSSTDDQAVATTSSTTPAQTPATSTTSAGPAATTSTVSPVQATTSSFPNGGDAIPTSSPQTEQNLESSASKVYATIVLFVLLAMF